MKNEKWKLKNEKSKNENENENEEWEMKNEKINKNWVANFTLDTTIVIILNYYITSSSYDLIEKEKVKTYKIQYQNNVRVGGIGIQYCIHPPKSRNSSAACAPVKR